MKHQKLISSQSTSDILVISTHKLHDIFHASVWRNHKTDYLDQIHHIMKTDINTCSNSNLEKNKKYALDRQLFLPADVSFCFSHYLP